LPNYGKLSKTSHSLISNVPNIIEFGNNI